MGLSCLEKILQMGLFLLNLLQKKQKFSNFCFFIKKMIAFAEVFISFGNDRGCAFEFSNS